MVRADGTRQRLVVAGRAAGKRSDPTDQANENSKEHVLGMAETIGLVYDEAGVSGFYKGLKTQLLNAVLKEAVVNTVRKELSPDAAS